MSSREVELLVRNSLPTKQTKHLPSSQQPHHNAQQYPNQPIATPGSDFWTYYAISYLITPTPRLVVPHITLRLASGITSMDFIHKLHLTSSNHIHSHRGLNPSILGHASTVEADMGTRNTCSLTAQ